MILRIIASILILLFALAAAAQSTELPREKKEKEKTQLYNAVSVEMKVTADKPGIHVRKAHRNAKISLKNRAPEAEKAEVRTSNEQNMKYPKEQSNKENSRQNKIQKSQQLQAVPQKK